MKFEKIIRQMCPLNLSNWPECINGICLNLLLMNKRTGYICSANDICKESKRQTINAEDVFKALEEIEFPEFVEPLKASLEG